MRTEELVANYERYMGKSVIVSGEVVSGPEMTVMYLPQPVGKDAPVEAMLITLSGRVAGNPDKIEKDFIQALRKTGRANAVIEGRFEGAAGRRWGHEACCRFRLQVEHVLSLK